MEKDVDEVGKIACKIKAKLQEIDRDNLANRNKPGCEKGTGVDRSRMALTAALKKKLKDRMNDFQNLRKNIQDDYREVVERAVFTVTGTLPTDQMIDRLIATGNNEQIFQKAIQEMGRGQVFMDMAVLVEAQEEILDNIESQVATAVNHVQSGNNELLTAKNLSKSSRKCMFIAIVILLAIAAVIVLSILKPWKLMGIDASNGQTDNPTKKKTPNQLQSLEKFYSEEKYPEQTKMEEYASLLNLTYNQIRSWFVERRRKERRENETMTSNVESFLNGSSSQASKFADGHGRVAGITSRCATERMYQLVKQKARHKVLEQLMKSHSVGRINHTDTDQVLLQILLSKDYILKKIFRKDGPTLGIEFDAPPGNALGYHTELQEPKPCHGKLQTPKRRKALVSHILATRSLPESDLRTRKHGMGKGLMTVWHATCPSSQKLPTGVNYTDRSASWKPLRSTASRRAPSSHVSKQLQQRESRMRQSSQRKSQERRKPSTRIGKVSLGKDMNQKEPCLKDCKLFLDKFSEQSSELIDLVDDEELELKELQVGSNPFQCSAHLASNGRHGCPLCKDLLARFPPQTVKMKQLFSARPWDSSPELVKKLFKVVQFILTHSVTIEAGPFTLDEFVQAFHDKDSLLLGKVHVALLKLLMLDTEKEITAGFIPRASNACRFLVFFNFVREQDIDVDHWRRSLNPLTWVEILRHVLIAAGFGSKQNTAQRGNYNRERNRMEKYGLRPRTLKGELFSLLSKQGSGGLKVSELAGAPQIVELGLPNTTEELEKLIYSTLSSDITLFEKIGPSAYRLRVDPQIKGKGDSHSDTEDSGSVDDDSEDDNASGSSDDCEEMESTIHDRRIIKYNSLHKKISKRITEYTEIDESYSGEAWMQGLMEGEYSTLSIEEKMDAIVALVDLVGGCSSLRMEEPVRAILVNPNERHRGSAHDPGHRRVYFESSEDGHWEVIETAQALHSLLSVLDSRGTREACLLASLEKRKLYLCEAMNEHMTAVIGSRQTKSSRPSDLDSNSGDGSSPISDVDNYLISVELDSLSGGSCAIDIETGRSSEEKKQKWDRLQAYDKWVWNMFYYSLNAVKYTKRSYMESLARCESCHDLFWRDEKHCKTCHTTFEIDFDLEERYAIHVATCREPEDVGDFPKHRILSSQLQALKAAIHAIEASMPEAALAGTWTTSAHRLWVKRLRRTSSLPELLQVLTDLVGALNEEWLYDCATLGSDIVADDVILQFQTMPQTTSAVALWMVKLDSLIAPHLERVQSERIPICMPQSKRMRGL
ncbi:hypothetical protein MUK42_12920 [Musa troglodytarum]|uniref:Homeobox-DDT domain protein RLT3 n=1 Tax=Musa troglodytarum TaxID=320322 RepID=A0A9E7GVW7_9LILI|nr:hypothetical protein MUK42_12920 [Musa troglodytarum]